MDTRIDALIKENGSLKAENEALRRDNAELRLLIMKLQERISHLESQLNKNSKNSSKPPSSDQKPNIPPSGSSSTSGRPFHPGASRTLLPEQLITSREIRILEECPHCHKHMESLGAISKWQQIELPEIKPFVHQIELQSSQCPHCHYIHHPELKEDEKYLLGPRFEAFVNLCLGQFRQSHRAVRDFIATLIPDLQLSQGLISKIKSRASKAFEAAAEQIRERLFDLNQPVHSDATGWRHLGKNEHVVVLRSGNFISFTMVQHQNRKTLSELFLGKQIHLVSDRGLPVSSRVRQYCLAHLIRNIRGLADHPEVSLEDTEKLGELHDTIQSLFHDKHRMERGEISINTWKQYGYATSVQIQDQIDDILSNTTSKKLRRFCKRLINDWSYFITYLRRQDSPMTNNPAEEALRTIVIARKLCFGSRSQYGRKWRASMLSCIETLRRHGKSVLDFLSSVISSVRTRQPYPSIIG